jgi:tRNA (guanine-N7-)-methyltransferase
MAAFPGKKPIWSTRSKRRPPERRCPLTPTKQPARRRILYGRRSGRPLRAGQRALVENLLPTIEIDLDTGSDNFLPRGPFEGSAHPVIDIWLEIGFGGGEHLAWQASNNPDVGVIGCEPFMNGVVKLLGQIQNDDLGNIRLFRDDARMLVDSLPDASIARAFVLFPDPWPKTRHNKRRIISAPVIAGLARVLADDAELRIATDDPGYLEWILWHMQQNADFDWQARMPREWRARPDDWPPTRYEQKAARAGRSSAFLSYIRRARA